MKSLVIVNPQAGNGRAGREWAQSQKRLAQRIGAFEVVFTKNSGHAEALARDALIKGYEHIHAYGGDGTATEVISGFFEKGRPVQAEALLSIWPAGTGCDFHRSLSLPDSFQHRGTDSVTPLDVGHLNFVDHQKNPKEKYFLNIASCGLTGYVDRLMQSKWRKFGSISFLVNTMEGLMRYKNRPVRIRTDHGDLGEKMVRMVAIANGKYFGGGMKVAPDARIDDGKFQLVIMGDIGVVDALMHTPHLYAGKHLGHPKIETQDITWAELTSPEDVLLDLDGEPLGTLPLRVEIMPGAVRLKTYD